MLSNNPRAVKYTGRGAEILYYWSHSLYKKGFVLLSRFIKRFNQLLFHVNIPPQVIIGKRLQLPHGGFGVVMHSNTIIGNDAIIFHNVTIANGGAKIGDSVYIGVGAVIIGDISIGNNVTIGANTVVNFNVPDDSTVVGIVGKIVK